MQILIPESDNEIQGLTQRKANVQDPFRICYPIMKMFEIYPLQPCLLNCTQKDQTIVYPLAITLYPEHVLRKERNRQKRCSCPVGGKSNTVCLPEYRQKTRPRLPNLLSSLPCVKESAVRGEVCRGAGCVKRRGWKVSKKVHPCF